MEKLLPKKWLLQPLKRNLTFWDFLLIRHIHINLLDIPLFNEQMRDLIDGKEVVYKSDKYDGTDGNLVSKHLFDSCGVKYRQMDKSIQHDINISLKPDKNIEIIKD